MKRSLYIFGIFFIFLANLVLASTYTIEFNQIGDKIVIKETFPNNQTNYSNDLEALDSSGKNLYFLKKINFLEDYSEAIIRLNLEEGVIVNKNEAFPAGYSFESDGKGISVVWRLENIQKSQTVAIFVELQDTKNDTSFYFALFMGVLLSILVFYLILEKLVFKKRRQIERNKIAEKIGVAPSKKAGPEPEKYEYLLDAEKIVIGALKKAERNELWQKQIQNLTGFSKAKVSRLINNLEQRNLIRKINFGNTNKIRLK